MKRCTVGDCERSAQSRGLCSTHYSRWHKYGDPTVVHKRGTKATTAPCSVGDCGRKVIAQGLCSMHYQRLRLMGDVGDAAPMKRANGSGWLRADGYWAVYDPTHPTANKAGAVGIHRRTLYDAIGPGEHSCHWCRRTVRWDVAVQDGPNALTVDHLDWNAENNDPANLVPSCNACNCRRTTRQVQMLQMRFATLALMMLNIATP